MRNVIHSSGNTRYFGTAVLQNIAQDARLRFERLPRKCSATFMISLASPSERVLGIKIFAKPQSPEWQLKTGKFRGHCILWQEGLCIIMADWRVYQSASVYLPTIAKTHPEYCIEKNKLTFVLVELLKESCEKAADIAANVKCQIGYLAVAAKKRESFNVEVASQRELSAILGSDRYVITPEGCKADAGFRMRTEDDLCLPVETKACTMGTSGRLNVFGQTAGYTEQILLCRPMLEKPVGTLVIPGDTAPNAIGLCLTPTSKYMPYVVQDADLLGLLANIYRAVANQQASLHWPSGLKVSISSVKLTKIAILSTPQSQETIIEREAFLWRKTMFPDVLYAQPPSLQGTVDCIIEQIRV